MIPKARRGEWWAVLSAVLLVVGVVTMTIGLRDHREAPGLAGPGSASGSNPVSPATGQRPPSGQPTGLGPTTPQTSTAGPRGNATRFDIARSTPVQVRVIALHLKVALTKLGLNPDGTVQVPTNPDLPGWYRRGPAPGQPGSAVILGHVDSYDGPAVFYRLATVAPGDRITVLLASGIVAHYLVSSVHTYPNADFPARTVYGTHGVSRLKLVTCGGGFDRVAGHYLGNVVVFAHLVHLSRLPADSSS